MSTSSRRKSFTLIEELRVNPHKFSFDQAVRLIEYANFCQKNEKLYSRYCIGDFNPITNELIRFEHNANLAYVENDIDKISDSDLSSPNKTVVEINFFGLFGNMGVMPYHYTEFLLQRQKQKDESFVKFMQMFNHRLISLLYKTLTKHSIPLSLEQAQITGGDSKATNALLSLIGLGTKGLNNRLTIPDHSLIYYSSLFINPIRNVEGLKHLLADFFNLSVTIKQFVGKWENLLDDVRTQLADINHPKGQNAQLGRSAMLGSRAFITQSKIQILIGPLSSSQLNQFAPGTATFNTMNQLVQFYVGLEHDYEFVMEINPDDLPDKLMLSKNNPPIMGWNTWLKGTSGKEKEKQQSIKIKISAKHF